MQAKRDDAVQEAAVMGTNNSSIVSKRSVERLYYPRPHFFRYFVPKPQRRSPLINRGYWLRMRVVEDAVRRFLDSGCLAPISARSEMPQYEDHASDKLRVVLNLGCG